MTAEKIPRTPNISLAQMVSMKNLPLQLQGIIQLKGFQFVYLSFKLPCISYRQTFPITSLVRHREANSTCNGEQDTALSPVVSAPLDKLLKFSASCFLCLLSTCHVPR